MPALLTRMSRRPCRSTIVAGQLLERRAIGHVDADAPRPGRRCATIAATVVRRVARRAPRRPRSRPARRAARAIARPMPRDAPVTSATLPVRSNISMDERQRRSTAAEIVRASPKLDDRGLAVDLAHQPAQHRPRTHLNIRCDALRRKAAHDGLPAHRRRDLATSASIAAARVALRLGVDVGDDRHARIVRRPARAARAPAAPRPASSARSGTARSPAAARRAWRRAPWRARRRARTASRAPAITTWPAPFRFAGLTTSPSRRLLAGLRDRRRRRGRGSPPSRRCRPARPPACSGRAAARSAARRRTPNVPAATWAEYSPRLWPATNAGCDAPATRAAGTRRC